MRSKAFLTNMEDLETWFKQAGNSEWNLYRGHQEKLNALHLIASQRASISEEESWEQLSKFIEMNTRGGGDVTIFVPGGGNGRGFLQHFSIERAGVAGLGQPGAIGWGMGYLPVDELERRLKAERDKWELERRIEDLEAEQESSGGIWGPVVKEALSGIDINSLIKMGYVALMAKMSPGTISPQITLNGMEQSEQHEQEYEDGPLDKFIMRVRPHFKTDQEFLVFLDKVADFFEKNPAMCLNFFATQN